VALSAAQVHSGPAGYQRLTAHDVAESLKVLARLDSIIGRRPDSAPIWYRRGMIAWALAARDNVLPPIRGLDWTLLGHMADTSLRKSAQLDPDKIDYRIAAGRYLASSFGPLNRTAASVQYGQALKQAEKIADPELKGNAALAAGRLYFRFYDSKEYKAFTANDPTVDLGFAPGGTGVPPPSVSEVQGLLNGSLKSIDFPGEYFYLKAGALFEQAAKTIPASGDLFRARATFYAARERWTELDAVGRQRIADASWDPWGWMATALASYRQRAWIASAAMFDTALAHFDTASLHRVDHIERILRPADSVSFAKLTPADRFASERLYWLMADPMWSVLGNEPRLEFLARVAYAEFRWSSAELGELGADTDRGRTYIRWGPPAMARALDLPPAGPTQMTWLYTGLGTVEFRGYDYMKWWELDHMNELVRLTPVLWTNIKPITVDSMPVQVARFRANADSIDVYIAERAPADSIRRTAEVTGNAIGHLWVLRGGTVSVAHDSVALPDSGFTSFTHRLKNGNYVYRAEAMAVSAKTGARSTGIITTEPDSLSSFAPSGFGMSDVLVAGKADARAGTAARWRDLAVTPAAGPVKQKGEVSLVWENYDFGAENGDARYTVTITIERDRSKGGAIAAGIVRGIAGTVGVNQFPDRMEITFDRTVPHAGVLLENVALGLGDTTPGNYKLIVRVADAVSGRATSWTGKLEVVQ